MVHTGVGDEGSGIIVGVETGSTIGDIDDGTILSLSALYYFESEGSDVVAEEVHTWYISLLPNRLNHPHANNACPFGDSAGRVNCCVKSVPSAMHPPMSERITFHVLPMSYDSESWHEPPPWFAPGGAMVNVWDEPAAHEARDPRRDLSERYSEP